MKTVFRADDAIMANLICGMLENEGVPATVNGEYLTGAFGEFPVMGQVRIVVDEEYEAKAKAVIKQFDEGKIALPDASQWQEDSDDEDSPEAP